MQGFGWQDTAQCTVGKRICVDVEIDSPAGPGIKRKLSTPVKKSRGGTMLCSALELHTTPMQWNDLVALQPIGLCSTLASYTNTLVPCSLDVLFIMSVLGNMQSRIRCAMQYACPV